jgi:hypothetical protein
MLAPKPRREPPRKVVERMRQSPAYEGLPSRSKALVDLLVTAVLEDGEANGGISMTVPALMAALGTRSRKQFYKAVDAAIAAGIVAKGSRALSHGQHNGSSNLWGLRCLPDDHKSRSKKRAEAVSRGGTKWGDEVDLGGRSGGQAIDLARGGCGVVYDPSGRAPSEAHVETEEARRGRSGTSGVSKPPVQPAEESWGGRPPGTPRNIDGWTPECDGYACGKAGGCLWPGLCAVLKAGKGVGGGADAAETREL